LSRPPISFTIEIDPDALADLLAERGTGPARRGFRQKFETQVDPAGALPPDERARLAAAALREHMSRLGQSSGQSRRARKEAASVA
jgi:hypothetical protein